MFQSEIIEIYNDPITQVIELNTSEIELLEIQQALVIQERFSNNEIDWISITDGQLSIQMQSSKGYFLFNTVNTNFILPLNPPNKSVIEIYAGNSMSFIIQQNAQDTIQFGDKSTTLGTSGQLANSSVGDHLKLMYYSSKWLVLSGSQGNFFIN